MKKKVLTTLGIFLGTLIVLVGLLNEKNIDDQIPVLLSFKILPISYKEKMQIILKKLLLR